MRHLGNEEKAALLLTPDGNEEEVLHDMTDLPSRSSNDHFSIAAKRPRTYHRHRSSTTQPILCLILILGAFILGCVSGVVIILYRMSQDAENKPATLASNLNVDLSIQTKLSQALSITNFLNLDRSIQNENDAANKLYTKWQSLFSPSLDHVNQFSYDVMLSKYAPSTQWSGIELLDGQNETELLKLDRLSTNDFLSFSSLLKSGTVNANSIFYVNYGRQEDFAYLIQNRIRFIEPEKSIVFMRRQSSIISQTEQIHQAIFYGFSGLVLFDDENQQITTTNNRLGFFEEWRRYYDKQDRDEYLDGKLKNKDHSISVLILSSDDVQRIFASLQPDSNQWSTCPLEWHQKSTTMKLGGTLTTIKLRLVVNVEENKVQLPIVMSSIRGTMNTEHFIMIGFQLKSIQQNQIINEIIQTYTNQIKSGWKPKRSILFCGWSGLNYDHYTIRRWISDNFRMIDRNLIAYLDLGNDILGNATLNLHGSPLLEQVAYRAADFVASPLEHSHTCHHREMTTTTTAAGMSNEENHHHDHSRKRRDSDGHGHHMEANQEKEEEMKCESHKLVDEWLKANQNRSLGIVQSIDIDSSASIFLLEYGIPSIVIEMTDAKKLSNDTLYVRYEPTISVDREMKAEVFVAYTQFITEMIRQLVDEPLLSFNLTNYAQQLDKLAPEFAERHKKGYGSVASHIADPSELTKTMNELTKSIRQVQSRINQISKTDYIGFQSINQQLIDFERLFISNDKLYGVNSPHKTFKHVLFGPAFGLTNTVVLFPSLANMLYGLPGDPPTELCDASKLYWSKLNEYISAVNRTINGFDGLLTKIN